MAMSIFIVHPRNVFSHNYLLQKFTNTKLFSIFSNKSFFHIHTSVSILEGQWCVLFRAHTPASKLSPTDVTNSVISEEPDFKPDMWVPWVHERNFKIEQQRKRKKFETYSATSLVRPKLEELIPEKNSLEKIPKPLKRWMGRPQLLPEIVENVLRSLWWGNGSKQPSPCLQPPKVGGLLRHLLLLLKAPLTSLHF